MTAKEEQYSFKVDDDEDDAPLSSSPRPQGLPQRGPVKWEEKEEGMRTKVVRWD